jgi:pyruvate dehydrogenase E2 component (dihydrolipoamide acetyltransferase)
VEQYATADAAKGAPGGEGRRLRISPLARRMAIENHIDPTRIPGSGPGGRIIQRDVMAFVGSGASPKGADGGSQRPARSRQTAPAKPAGPQIQPGQTQVVAMSKMRSAIASALQRSKQQVPHFYETVDVDADQLTKVRESLNQRLESQNIRLSLADLIYKAVATALTQHPAVNARYNPEKNEITRYGDVNLGIAVAIPDGLIVPVLRGVNRMDLKTIRQQGADLIERARAQRLRREEQSEATFTISNLGNYGIREFSAIINPPEVAILAVGSAEKRAVVRFDSIVPRTMMTLTLSADHRAVDGATAAEFMRTLKATLEEPGLMLE